jgi:hypothetical protein
VFVESIEDMLRSFDRLALPARIKGPYWLDGARPPTKYVFKNYEFDELENLTNLDL